MKRMVAGMLALAILATTAPGCLAMNEDFEEMESGVSIEDSQESDDESDSSSEYSSEDESRTEDSFTYFFDGTDPNFEQRWKQYQEAGKNALEQIERDFNEQANQRNELHQRKEDEKWSKILEEEKIKLQEAEEELAEYEAKRKAEEERLKKEEEERRKKENEERLKKVEEARIAKEKAEEQARIKKEEADRQRQYERIGYQGEYVNRHQAEERKHKETAKNVCIGAGVTLAVAAVITTIITTCVIYKDQVKKFFCEDVKNFFTKTLHDVFFEPKKSN